MLPKVTSHLGSEEALLSLVAGNGGSPRLVCQLRDVLQGCYAQLVASGGGGGGGSSGDDTDDEDSILMHQMLPSKHGHTGMD